MSDGNYNRSHLPRNDYQSGVRAGKASERVHALNTFVSLIEKYFPNLSDEERNTLRRTFHAMLNGTTPPSE